MTTTDKSLLFDETLELCGGEAADGSYWFEVLAEGASWGDPEPVERVVDSLLRDGVLVEKESDGNRVERFQIKVCSTDPVGLSEGVAALHRATGKRTTLRWQDGDYPATVVEVETSRLLEPGGFDDLRYNRNEVVYVLSLTCLPGHRGESQQSTAATAVPSVGDVINNCESTTAFTWEPTPFQSSGAVLTPVTPFAIDSSRFVEGAGSLAVQPNYGTDIGYGPGVNGGSKYEYGWYVDLDESPAAGSYLSFAFYASNYNADSDARSGLVRFWVTTDENGEVEYDVFSSGDSDVIVQAIEGGFVQYTVRLDDPVHLTRLRWYARQDDPTALGSEPYPSVLLDRIALAESATLGSQVLKTIAVGGSARTTGSLHIASPTDAVGLGQVVAYTVARDRVPTGFRPDLRQWDDGTGGTTPDADATNGSYYSVLGTSSTYSDPSPALLAPASLFNSTAHTMVARLTSPAAEGTDLHLGVQAQLIIDGDEVGEPLTVQRDWDDTGAAGYEMVPLGTLYLPPLPIAAATSEALVRFRFRGNVYLDELYAFPVDGDLSIIDCGAGTSGPSVSSHLWIDSPSQTQPQGGYWRGPTGDRVNAISAWAAANVPGTHSFEPGDVLAFVASTGTLGPTVDLANYERFLFHATR